MVPIFATLDFLASGSYQRRVGNSVHPCMSQTSISRSIRSTIDAIQQIMHRWIKFPSTRDEMEIVRNRFQETYGFPGVVGVVDGTHICITPPNSDIEETYFNRKGFHSLNAMIVSYADNKILAVNARYGGRANDARVYNNSILSAFMNQKYAEGLRRFWLIVSKIV
ncbi:putative nuclease HARBI1 [Leptopilina boulardi]|uniref:putative nuclease HARBI1 n=1 Tax=Leptopilina boulardi TaxID=63433 RepID=UPI0021F55BB7|nr:putative nuclease HARBI1 [Leptopilina boulardi]